ncbi:hypothetical protein GCM10025857_06330 [Alicyclobacillus contaminans]|nr:hypothetical protein GCM10025857_06330 [Alicyclobacillus contaminans]
MTQKYDKEFKLHAVQLALESGKPANQVARELGISQKTLYGWVAKYKETLDGFYGQDGTLGQPVSGNSRFNRRDIIVR